MLHSEPGAREPEHCDPGVLALVSLGERPGEQDARHLATCAVCQADVADLAGVVSAVRVEIPAGPPIAPPARVWDAIAAQTGVTASPAESSAQPPAQARQEIPLPQQVRTPQGQTPARRDGTVLTLRPRTSRRSGLWRTVAVAAAALVVGAAGGSVVTHQLTGENAPPRQVVLAQAGLRALPLAPGSGGKAIVVQTAQGPKLDVDVSSLGTLDGRFYEVWLIDSSVKKMVPVGILRGTNGEFVIPDGLNLADYPVVDISIQEPGNPEHSGKSVLRGTLPA